MALSAGLANVVDFRVGDAVAMIAGLPAGIDFVLVDLYEPCLEALYPKINPGAIVVSDNMIYPGGEDVARYARAVRAKPRLTSMDVELTGDADVDFARAMVPHHRGAIDMARVQLEHGEDPELAERAREIIAAQEEEIDFLRAWLATHGG
jgi:hypothetical protein